ncbi:flagellar motor protein MotB [Shewanella fidelis]|uniref:OmpA family protein n=1 Tax=Shewanella fidelis TaxID=173509 RepID=A0AAW8NTS9_9GAMM|nr:flagellar motor protein MotB [Shewanella fidelis]MDR8525900.1 OmpA family protein [Shewanella fidelis]MDW4813912.1 OmpA family protein [Shewanella fidelis]MDW4817896.1 OmpA family protein [Shewanella fidelis]MDW4821963.1 OmpA family protein [Shewanella fidelis]MDW4826128.1 OmpA family protein [Shewanella fidelis]
MLTRSDPIVIRRKKQAKSKPAHGGAWKVAFADFTLAMMALFMVLWIMQIADQQERTMIVQYLNGDLYDNGSINPFDLGGAPSMLEFQGNLGIQQAVLPATSTGVDKSGPAMHNRIPFGEENAKAGKGPELNSLVPGKFETQAQLEFLAKEIDNVIKDISMGANVDLQVVPQGVRILMHDNVHQFMFTRGSAEMMPYFEDLLMALAPLLTKVENKITISGHTDSSPYAGKTFTNWELSSKRALLARRVLEYGGIKRSQVIQVTGMADQAPYVVNDPAAAANRRIEVLVMTSAAENQLKQMMGIPVEPSAAKAELQQAKQAAEKNQARVRYPQQWTNQ